MVIQIVSQPFLPTHSLPKSIPWYDGDGLGGHGFVNTNLNSWDISGLESDVYHDGLSHCPILS